jgi:hypothetical protein
MHPMAAFFFLARAERVSFASFAGKAVARRKRL